MVSPLHFIDLRDFDAKQMNELFSFAKNHRDLPTRILTGSHIGAIFEKASMRTEFALGFGVPQAGGILTKHVGDITENPAHYGRALAASGCDAAIIRAVKHDKLHEIAKHSPIPIINGLTDASHPCLLLADMLTVENPKGLKIAFIGAATNVAKTYAQAAPLFGFQLALGMPQTELNKISANNFITCHTDAINAARQADVIVTDQWGGQSPGDYTVTMDLLRVAKKDAIFMHPMPISTDWHEVSPEVIDSPQSRVDVQTRNRTPAFVATLAFCLGKN